MLVLTTKGARRPDELDAGAELLSRDAVSGRLICNRLESRPRWIDRAEFARWWNWRPPAFRFLRVNRHFVFSRSQSIWANGFVTHVAKLRVGDVIYTERNGFVRVHELEEVRRRGWWRFEVDGDHSYILDGALVHNASRFWVGGTGTWDAVTTTNWAASSGGAGSQSVPGSADTVTFDGSSGGGTCTVNFGGTITIQSLSCGTYTSGTLDFSANNNNVTLSSSTALSCTGTATRTFNMGNGNWNLTDTAGNATILNFATVTNLTFNANSSVINITNSTLSTRVKTLQLGGKTFSTINLLASGQGGYWSIGGSGAITNFGIAGPAYVAIGSGLTVTTSALTITGASSTPVGIASNSVGVQATISSASNQSMSWVGLRDMAFSGGGTFAATNSQDLGNNSGVTVIGPSSGAGVGIIGS